MSQKLNIQPKIEKLLKGLAKKEPLFVTLFDSDLSGCPKERKDKRQELAVKHIKLKTFGELNNCKVSIGPFSFVFYNDDFRYLGYWYKGAIEVERKPVR